MTWAKPSDQITPADARKLISAAESADGPDVRVSLGGPAITNSERAGLGRSVGVGIAAALAVLLVPALMHCSARPTGPCPAGSTGCCPAWPPRPMITPPSPIPKEHCHDRVVLAYEREERPAGER